MALQAVLHGLGDISGKRSKHPVRRLKDMRSAVTLSCSRNIQYIALELDVKEAIINKIPSLKQNLEVIEHPIPPNEEMLHSIELNLPVKFGFLGRVQEVRGFPVFLNLASEMVKEYQDRVEFHVVGRCTEKNFSYTTDALATKPSSERLERHKFIEMAKKLHFIIFPLSPQFYQLTASGSLMDAVAWEKPIIAGNIPMLTRLFRNYGDIGYIFHDELELYETVKCIIEKCDNRHYELQINNMKKVREGRSANVLGKAYREICAKMPPKL
jgi:glycosyltransferase involved in cell wall biosynthesis